MSVLYVDVVYVSTSTPTLLHSTLDTYVSSLYVSTIYVGNHYVYVIYILTAYVVFTIKRILHYIDRVR